MVPFFAVAFRGLEAVSAQEIAEQPGMVVTQIAYRRVLGTCASLTGLLGLRTVDDVFLHAADWSGIERQRVALQRITTLSEQLDLRLLAAACATIRPIPAAPIFSVTASFVGHRNYNSDEIKQAVAEGITRMYGWRYADDDAQAHYNLRLFIEHDQAVVGLRLSQSPLHERRYQRTKGSLKAPVAAAMLRLAEVEAGQVVLDPCCGSGTIISEAVPIGARALGGDLDLAALAAARINAGGGRVTQWDARQLPIPAASVARIVTNLPWGRQVTIDAALADFYAEVSREMQRVIKPSGRIAVLTSTPELVALPDLVCTRQIEISLFGQTPSILVFSAPDQFAQ